MVGMALKWWHTISSWSYIKFQKDRKDSKILEVGTNILKSKEGNNGHQEGHCSPNQWDLYQSVNQLIKSINQNSPIGWKTKDSSTVTTCFKPNCIKLRFPQNYLWEVAQEISCHFIGYCSFHLYYNIKQKHLCWQTGVFLKLTITCPFYYCLFPHTD